MSRGGDTTRGRSFRRGCADRGQSTVELALALPLLTLVLLLVVQVALIVREQVLVTSAAREAVRAAATVGPDDRDAIERAAIRAGPLDPGRLDVQVSSAPDRAVEVRVRYRSRTDLPLIGALVPDVDLVDRAVMRLERAP